jgi:subtilisin-like proprotein convertase family protein
MKKTILLFLLLLGFSTLQGQTFKTTVEGYQAKKSSPSNQVRLETTPITNSKIATVRNAGRSIQRSSNIQKHLNGPSTSELKDEVKVSKEMQQQIERAQAVNSTRSSSNTNNQLAPSTYVGSFNVIDGPNWTTNPPCLNALEAAALIFGGSPSDYVISTNPNTVDPSTITNTAWVTTWGIGGCQEQPENYSLDLGNPGYNDPGGSNTASSAYVQDNCSAINYVWTAATAGCPPFSLDGPFCNGCSDPGAGTALACSAGPNSIIQGIDVSGVPGNVNVLSFEYVQDSQGTGPGNVTVNVFCGSAGANPPPFSGNAAPLYSETFAVNGADDGSCVSLAFTTPPTIDATCDTMWVEVLVATGRIVYTPSVCNANAATGSNTYIAAPACGLASPLPFSAIGFALDAGFSATFVCNLGEPPVISCPMDITVSNDPGICGANVSYANAIALDPEDGQIPTVQTIPDPNVLGSGDEFPLGDTEVTFSATDSDGNTSTCTFTITVEDNEDPVIACQDITVELDAAGNYSLTPGEVLGSSSDNCGIDSVTFLVTPDPIGDCATDNPQPFGGANGTPVSVSSVIAIADSGIIGVDYNIDNVTLDITHSFDADVDIRLQSPAGTILDLSTGNGGSGDNYSGTTFQDGAPNVTTGSAPFAGTYSPEGGSFAGTYGGQEINGNWTLLVSDNFPPFDDGVLNDFCINFVPQSVAQNTIDLTCANIGENDVTVVVTDAAGNSSSCMAVVTVLDVTAPEIVCIGEPIDSEGLINGSFESGDFSGWTVVDFAVPFVPYFVGTSNNGGGFFSDALPTDGAFLAGNGFDAAGPDESLLYQDVSIVAGASALLTWDENIDYDLDSFCNGCVDRIYEVQVRDINNNILEVLTQVTAEANTIDSDNVWESKSADLSAYEGQDIRIVFWQNVPENFTGPAKFALDNVSLSLSVAPNPLVVELDANGNATIDASALLLSVTEACDYVVTVGNPAPFINECGDNLPAPIDENLPPTESTATIAETGIVGDDYTIQSVSLDITHTFDGDLDIELISPSGTVLMLSDQNGGGGDNYTGTVFQDGGASIVAGTPPFTGVFEPQGGTFAATYGGEDIAGGWVLRVTDNFGGDVGTLDNFCINFAPIVSTEVDFDCSNLGLNQIEVTVTDSSGNSASCTATVEVLDVTDPILICQDVTIVLDENGMAEINPEDLLAQLPPSYEAMVIGSDNQSGTAGTTDFTVDVTDAAAISFDWIYTSNDPDPGFDSFGYLLNGVYTQLTDPGQGNQNGTANVNVNPGDVFGFRAQTDDNIFGNTETVVTNFVPGFSGQFAPANWVLNNTNSDGDAYFVEIPGGPASYDACGITVLATDITDVTCADIGTPITVTVFASDASGNLASCTAIVTVVDETGPVIENCPEDQTVDPGPLNLFYELPDYWTTGTTATDNCTDPVTILSQDPPAGTLLPDGVYTITMTAEDEYENVGTCTFELTIESILGIENNQLENGVVIYPNPAQGVMNIANATSIQLESAAIYDMNGRLVQNINLSDMVTEKAVDVSNLASGVYMVQIMGEGGQTVKRLVKE